MRTLNALLASVCIVGFYGCALPAEGETEGVSAIEVDALALEKGRLLALGDSIAFGYDPFGDFTKDKNFAGYPEELKSEYSLKNASCPGETSDSFIDATAPDNGCRTYRATYPLHVNYRPSTTQLDYALRRVTSEEAEDVPTLITLNIGGNNIFLLQASCGGDPACFAAGAPALIANVAQDVATILGSIRQAGYAGDIIYQTLYSTDYTNPSTVGFLTALNGAVSNVARSFGATIADGYGAFQTAAAGQSPCAAGLLVPNPAGGCDVHPSPAGDEVLADSVRNAQ
jgi:lysophospholipase L1-like esterase